MRIINAQQAVFFLLLFLLSFGVYMLRGDACLFYLEACPKVDQVQTQTIAIKQENQ